MEALTPYTPDTHGFSPEVWQLIKDTICKGASNHEIELFGIQCARTGLDPLAKQIYLLSLRGGKQAVVSIDGYRLIAKRTGQYAGQLGPFWMGEDEVWRDHWIWSEPPLACKVGVLHTGFAEPIWGHARYSSYNGGTPIWQKMPEVMLAKCAESLAIRKAFPQELSGIYTDDELEQAHEARPVVTSVSVAPVAPQRRMQAPVEVTPVSNGKTEAKPKAEFTPLAWREWFHQTYGVSNIAAFDKACQEWDVVGEAENLVAFVDLIEWACDGTDHAPDGEDFGDHQAKVLNLTSSAKFDAAKRKLLSDEVETWMYEAEEETTENTAEEAAEAPAPAKGADRDAAAAFRKLLGEDGDEPF